MKNKGNKDFATHNVGHDVAKTRLSSKLKNSGFNIYLIRRELLKHPTIQALINAKAIVISDICGQDFNIKCLNILYSEVVKCRYNNNQTVVQVVNNVVSSILKAEGFKNVGKTEFWKKLNPKMHKYSDVILIGSDILSRNWILDTYTQKQFTCKLTDKDKNIKYNGWKH